MEESQSQSPSNTDNSNAENQQDEGYNNSAVSEGKNEQDLQVADGGDGEGTPSDTGVAEKAKTISLQEDSRVDAAVVDLLTRGFVEQFLPGLKKSQATVDQVKSSQSVLLETVQQEINKFKECTAVKDVEDMMVKARHFHNKLLRIRREMNHLHDKSKKLKKRALKLQQQKQTEELTRAHTREHELERERMLTARLAKPDQASS